MTAALERQLKQIECTLTQQLDAAKIGQIDQACRLMPQLQQQLNSVCIDLSVAAHEDAASLAVSPLTACMARIRRLHGLLSMAVSLEKQAAMSQLKQVVHSRQIRKAYVREHTHNLANKQDLA